MTLFDFTNEESVQQWRTQNDGVMGGVSSSQVTYLAEEGQQKGIARFVGEVSLENDGGFAQILYDRKVFDLTGHEALELHLRGDQQTYQLRLETDAKRVAYAQSFRAENTWQRVRLAFADFKPTFRGEDVPDAPALNLASVRSIGFLIGDKQKGPFALLIDAVRAYRD